MASRVIDQPRRLPVAVPLVRGEMIRSYLRRLAAANHLHADELSHHLDAPKRTCGPHQLDRLAVMTGHPAQWLRDMLATTVHPGNQRQRQACRRCTARRGIHMPVDLAAPIHHTLCRRHQRWLPDGYVLDGKQHDLRGLADVLNAHRKHVRLVREHGTETAGRLVDDAAHITARWTQRGDWDQHRQRRLRRVLDPTRWSIPQHHPVLALANYPETIALARLFGDPRWTEQATSTDRSVLAGFHAEVSRRLNIDYEPYTAHDPLLHWQRHARAARRDPEIVHLY